MNRKTNIIKPVTDREARHLLQLFEAGETSFAEEQRLYAYFRRRRLPADLRPLRPLMAWYENGCVGEPPAAEEPHRSGWWTRSRIVSVAASVAVLVAVGFMAAGIADRSPEDEFSRQYTNCYVIRNGKRVTDPREVREAVLRVEAKQDSIEHLIARTEAKIRAFEKLSEN